MGMQRCPAHARTGGIPHPSDEVARWLLVVRRVANAVGANDDKGQRRFARMLAGVAMAFWNGALRMEAHALQTRFCLDRSGGVPALRHLVGARTVDEMHRVISGRLARVNHVEE